MNESLLQYVRRLSGWLFSFKARNKGVESNAENFAGYEVKTHVGTSEQLVIAFSGVGNVISGEVQFEWGNSLTSACDGDHVIFVKDNLRSWYTREEGRQKVVALLQEYIKRHQIKNAIAFGLSMGGYGALVFSSLIAFDRVVVLSSRACVGKRSDFDTRNKSLMRDIPENAFSKISKEAANRETRYIFLASRDQCNDLKHLALLHKEFPEARFYLSRGDHNIGHEMNLQGKMKSFLQWLISGADADDFPGIEPADSQLLHLGEYMVNHRLHTLNTKFLSQYYPSLELINTPLFLLDTKVQLLLEGKSLFKAFPCPCNGSVSSQFLRHYLGLGWYAPDNRGGVWSQGLWHQLKGMLTTADTIGKRFQLRLHIEIFTPEEITLTPKIELFQNKQLIKSVELTRERKKHFMVFPLEIRSDGYFEVFIHTPFASMPAHKGKSEDCREIAIYLRSFVITHA